MKILPGTLQRRCIALLLGLLILSPAGAETLRIAVAANFYPTLEVLGRDFESRSDHKLILSSGSTGKHYAQIINGAPFDLFFAADVRRPRLLEREQRIVAGSRFTYAIGRLVLWSARDDFVDAEGQVLSGADFRRLAIANPRLAPYGQAAMEVLQQRELLGLLEDRLVRGENIAQAYQFVASGNAELGFVALSQLHQPNRVAKGSWWLVPSDLHSPIRQQAVMLRDIPVAREFVAYIKSEPAHQVLRRFGYLLPGGDDDQ